MSHQITSLLASKSSPGSRPTQSKAIVFSRAPAPPPRPAPPPPPPPAPTPPLPPPPPLASLFFLKCSYLGTFAFAIFSA